MKIYSKKGDKGKTSLIGGKIVDKHNLSVDAYGTVDELNSFIGLLKDYVEDKKINEVLHNIQLKLFSVGSILASAGDNNFSEKVSIEKKDIEDIESNIDNMNNQLPDLKNFIIPGGHKISSYCHVCRSICRRAERKISELNNHHQINPYILSYVNRLSDFFFVLSRHIKNSDNIEETYW
tara:strand:+ start:7112 stop:7648 length:537 start_codon:yes stop_codon:yes gene_type:complete